MCSSVIIRYLGSQGCDVCDKSIVNLFLNRKGNRAVLGKEAVRSQVVLVALVLSVGENV